MSRASWPSGASFARVAITLYALFGSPLPAAEPVAPLRFRRVFVPESELDQQVRGLLPLKRQEFERRIQQALQENDAELGTTQVRVESAESSARLEGTALVGRSSLAVFSSSTSQSFLPLAPCNLALHGASWEGDISQPALLGAAPDGRLSCLVEHSGSLALSWSIAGHANDQGELVFDLEWPSVTRHQLLLELPKAMMLRSDRGIATRADRDASAQSQFPATALWKIETGGSRLTLHIAAQPRNPGDKPLVLVKERTNYSVHSGIIDVESTLYLDALHQSLPQPILALDPALQLVDLRQGSQSLTWSMLSPVEGRQRIAVNLPETTAAAAEPIELVGISIWKSQDKIQLPRIEVIGGTWQDGQITISAADSLHLRATPLEGIRQTSFSPSTAVRPTDLWQFQQFLPGAAVEIAASDDRSAVAELSGTLFKMDATQVSATYHAQLEVANGPRFELEAQIPRAWIVDAIDVLPSDMLADRTLQARGAGPQILRLALRRPIAEGRALGVVVRAHRQRPNSEQELPSDLFSIVRWVDARSSRRLVACQVLDPAAQLSLSGDEELRRLDPATLTSMELGLFETPPGSLMFELDQGADALRARLQPTSPRYEASVFVRAQIDRKQIRERITVDCIPEASTVSRLHVRWSPPPVGEVLWRIAGEEPRELSARRMDNPASTTEEAVFEISLQRPRSAPFHLEAELARGRMDLDHLTLVSILSATSQSSQVEVRAAGDLPLAIDAEGMRPLPPPEPLGGNALPIRGAYRYDPGRSARLRVRVPTAGRSLPLAWVESLDLTSRWSIDGSGQHEATCLVQCIGQGRISFQLPPSAAFARATIDGHPVAGLDLSPVPGRYSISLPDARRAVVGLSFATHDRPFGWWPWGAFSSPIPGCDLPILATRWRVHAAQGIKLFGRHSSQPGAQEPASPTSSPDLVAWNSYDIDPASLSGSTIHVYRPIAVEVWSWCLALATAAVVMRWGAGRGGALILLAGAVAALTALAPLELAPLGRGMFVGLALGGAAILFVPLLGRLGPIGLEADFGSTSTAPRVTAGAWVMLAVSVVGSLAQAAPPVESDLQAPPWLRVVIPVDDARQPVGDYVFLDPKLYDGLVRLTEETAPGAPAWLLNSCQYRPTFMPANGGAAPRIEEINATIDIETFLPDVAVSLAFQRAQVHLLERRARLDREMVLPEWSSDGSQLAVQIAQPGRHKLELALGVVAKADGSKMRLEINIPPIPSSRLLLSADDHRCQVLSAQGATAHDGTASEWSVELGPTNRLVLAWPTTADDPESSTSLEVEQLLHWTIRAGSVVADARFRVRPLGGSLRELIVEIDPRLRPLPPPAGQSIARQWIEEGSHGNFLHVAFREPINSQTNVELSLLWAEASGIGNLALPKVSLQAGEAKRSWTALSLSNNLQWKSPPPVRRGDPTLDEFARAWGEPLVGESVAFDNASQTPIVATQPAQVRTIARQALDCSVSQSSAWIRSSIKLSALPAHTLQHTLQATPGLRITNLEVFEGNRPVRIRWSQGADGAVSVSQFQPPATDQRWEISGRMPLNRGQTSQAAPLVSYMGAAESDVVTRFYRRSDVRLTVSADEATWKPVVAAPLDQHLEGFGRLVSVLQATRSETVAAPTLTITPNDPEAVGYVVTRMVPGEPQWSVEIDAQVDVQPGALDSLRFQLPAAIIGPLEILPAVEHELVKLPGQSSQVLVVRPQRAVEDRLHVTIRGHLREPATGAVTLPVVTLLESPRVRHLAALPTRVGSRRLDWETSGLQSVEPIDLALSAKEVPAGYELFESLAPRVAAQAQARNPVVAKARVRLADHQILVQSPRQITGTSVFDVIPVGAPYLELSLPQGIRLVHVAVEGMPAHLTNLGGGRWRVATVSDRLPQRIEVVYAAVLPRESDSKGATIRPPRLGARPEKSLWTVSNSNRLSASATAAEPPLQHVERLESLAEVLDVVASAADQEPVSPSVATSFSIWNERLRLVQSPLAGAKLAPALSSRYRSALELAEAARNRLIDAGQPAPSASLTMTSPDADQFPINRQNPRFTEFGDGQGIRVFMSPAHSDPADTRLAWSCGIMLAACLFATKRVRSIVGRSVNLAIGLFGAAWLALGVAPWFGWVLIAVAVWLSMRSPWPHTGSQPLSSFIRPAA